MGAQIESSASVLAGCRMVLSVQCGDGALLSRMAELGVAGVGLDTDAENARFCRERQLLAWAGTWRTLATQRQRFDGIHVDLTRFQGDDEELEAMLRTLIEALVTGGRLLLTGPLRATGEIVRRHSSRFEIAASAPETLILRRRRGPAKEAPPGLTNLVIGPYADVFVGCEQAVEVGCGRGHFLDSLRLRDVPAHGIDADPSSVNDGVLRGLDVEIGGPDRLLDYTGTYDGAYLGNVCDPLESPALDTLLTLCHHAMRPKGRLLVRAARSALRPAMLTAACRSAGFDSIEAGTVRGDTRDFFVLGTRNAAPSRSVDPDRIPAIDTRGCTINQPLRSLHDLERFERRVFSQCGEDGVLEAIFAQIGVTNRFYVEFGCGDGEQCNTALLRRSGWNGLLMDGMADAAAEDAVIHREWISAENINGLFAKHGVPDEFDLLSVDLDGNDYWVLEELRHRPRVIVAEYNANLPVDEWLTIPYDAEHAWDGSDFYGASLPALTGLLREKGYRLVYCNQAGVNAFFVAMELVGDLPDPDLRVLYRPPNYFYRGVRHPPDLSRRMVDPRVHRR